MKALKLYSKTVQRPQNEGMVPKPYTTVVKSESLAAVKRQGQVVKVCEVKPTPKQDRELETLNWLRTFLKPGDEILTVLRHVSRSGMSRSIDLYVVKKGNPIQLSRRVAEALDMKIDETNGGIKIGGCGMDMGFALVYNLAATIFPDGVSHRGLRHSDGGYGLRHQWL